MTIPEIPEVLDVIVRHLNAEDLCNARLAHRTFASAGLRYLIPTIRVLRLPESFDTVEDILHNPVLRRNVKRLVYYLNSIYPHLYLSHEKPNKTTDEVLTSKELQILQRLKLLMQSLPNLKMVCFVDMFEYDAEDSGRFRPTYAWTWFKRLRRDSELNIRRSTNEPECTHVLSLVGNIEQLYVYDLVSTLLTRESPLCFKTLRRLELLVKRLRNWQDESIPRNFFKKLPVLEELCVSTRYTDEMGDYVPFDVELPKDLKVLELDCIQFSTLELPEKLQRLKLSNARLMNARIEDWSEVIQKWQTDCEFGGTFVAEFSGDLLDYRYRDCGDQISGLQIGSSVYLGPFLAGICTKRFPQEKRKAILDGIFDDGNCVRLQQSRTAIICLSQRIAEIYHWSFC